MLSPRAWATGRSSPGRVIRQGFAQGYEGMYYDEEAEREDTAPYSSNYTRSPLLTSSCRFGVATVFAR